MKDFILQLLHKIYPSFCLSCKEELSNPFDLLCTQCVHTLHLTYHDPNNREVYCFEPHSAAGVLLKAFERVQFSKLRDLIVSFMLLKFSQLNCGMPDVIIPAIKQDFSNRVNTAIASSFAKMIGRPYLNAVQWVLDPLVYDEQGDLVGVVTLRKKVIHRLRSTQHILILDVYGYAPSRYKQVCVEYPNITYLSFNGPQLDALQE